MEKRGSFFLFLIIIAVLTLIIAALVAFIILIGISPPAAVAETDDWASGPQVVYAEPPDESSLATMVLLEQGQPINLRTDDPTRPTYALVEMSVKYFIEVDGVTDANAKMSFNRANLQEIAITYFMAMNVEEFSNFGTKARVKEEMKKELNEFLLTTIPNERDRRRAGDMIYDVVFSAWNYN